MGTKTRHIVQCLLLAMIGAVLITISVSAENFEQSWGFAALGAVCYIYAIGKIGNL